MVCCAVLLFAAAALIWGAQETRARTGLPLPRFVSVKAKPANVRVGPGRTYPIKWTFARRYLPVEITAEFGPWRRIRDWEGDEGWIHGALLSGKRTALAAPWSRAKPVAMRRAPSANAKAIAVLRPNVLVEIDGCDGRWCEVEVRGLSGYVRQDRLWGAYPGEAF